MSCNTREKPIWNCTNKCLSKKKGYQQNWVYSFKSSNGKVFLSNTVILLTFQDYMNNCYSCLFCSCCCLSICIHLWFGSKCGFVLSVDIHLWFILSIDFYLWLVLSVVDVADNDTVLMFVYSVASWYWCHRITRDWSHWTDRHRQSVRSVTIHQFLLFSAWRNLVYSAAAVVAFVVADGGLVGWHGCHVRHPMSQYRLSCLIS